MNMHTNAPLVHPMGLLHSQRDCRKKGFAEIPIDPNRIDTVIKSIIEGMRRMTDSEADQKRFAASVIGRDEMGWDRGAGLWRRAKDESKFFYHLHGDQPNKDALSGIPEYESFFEGCDLLNTYAHQLVIRVAEMFDMHDRKNGTAYPSSLAEKFRNGTVVTRVLRYLERSERSVDAAIHLDRSGMTVHWYSSHPGLAIIDNRGHPQRIRETALDTIALFPGKKFAATTRGVYGPGTLHGVRAERNDGVRADRFAVVTFVHPRLDPEDVIFLKEKKDAYERYERDHDSVLANF